MWLTNCETWMLMIYNQIVTKTTFAILAVFEIMFSIVWYKTSLFIHIVKSVQIAGDFRKIDTSWGLLQIKVIFGIKGLSQGILSTSCCLWWCAPCHNCPPHEPAQCSLVPLSSLSLGLIASHQVPSGTVRFGVKMTMMLIKVAMYFVFSVSVDIPSVSQSLVSDVTATEWF